MTRSSGSRVAHKAFYKWVANMRSGRRASATDVFWVAFDYVAQVAVASGWDAEKFLGHAGRLFIEHEVAKDGGEKPDEEGAAS